MSSIHIEVLLASGYAVFLVAVAIGLEMLGRHTTKDLVSTTLRGSSTTSISIYGNVQPVSTSS